MGYKEVPDELVSDGKIYYSTEEFLAALDEAEYELKEVKMTPAPKEDPADEW